MANTYKKLFLIIFITVLFLGGFNFTKAMHCGLAFNNLSCSTKLPSEQSEHCKSCFDSNNTFYSCVDKNTNCPSTGDSKSKTSSENALSALDAIKRAEELGKTIGGIQNIPTTVSSIFDILLFVMGWIFRFAIAIGVIMIIISGLMYILSGGNSERAGKAIKLLLYTIIGIIIVALSWSILSIIRNLL